MRLASSMAIVGAGGDIFLKAREARKPASAASSSSTAATTKKPQKTVPLGNGRAQ